MQTKTAVTMHYAVYADLSRQLTVQERLSLSEALDVIVPGNGCVGLQKSPNDEAYFSLQALSEAAARALAERHMSAMLHKAALEVGYTLTLQRMNRA